MTPAEAADAAEHLAWERALDELEAFTYVADAQLRTLQPLEADPWSAPELGPIPADLTDRARDLLAHQQRLLEQMPAAMERVRQQRTVTAKFSQAAARGRNAVYVDASA